MTSIRKPTTLDIVLLVASALVWGGAFIGIKIAVPETGPLWLAAIRVTIGALVLLPYVLWRGLIFPRDTRTWVLIIFMTVLNVVVPFFLISWAEMTIDAGVTSILMGTGPFAAMIGSHFVTSDDRINGRKLLAVLMGFAGVLLIVGIDAVRGLGHGHLLAQFAALCGSLSYVAAGLTIRRIDYPPVRLAFMALAIGAVMLLVLAFAIDGPLESAPSGNAMIALAFLGILPTGIAYMIRFHLIRTIGYSAFAYGLNLIPVFGVVLGFLLLGEPLRPQVLIALALIVAGLFVARSGSTAPAADKGTARSGT